MWLWILIGLNFIAKLHGYAEAPFPDACISMSPVHLTFTGRPTYPQTSPPPFEITFKYGKKTEPVTVHLRGMSSTFGGFMLEARKRDEVDVGPPVGKFTLIDKRTTHQACSGSPDSAVRQVDNSEKHFVQVNWTAPEEEMNITFRATFVWSRVTYWERVIRELDFTTTTTTEPTTRSTTEPTTTSTTEPTTRSTTEATTTNTTEPTTTEPTTTSTTEPTTTTTTEPTTTSTTEPTATTTTEPTTTTTTEPTTTSTPEPTTTINTKFLVCNSSDFKAALILISVSSSMKEVQQSVTVIHNNLPHFLNKVLKILCCVLCAAMETLAVILLYEGDCCGVTLAALMFVVIVTDFIQLPINALPFGPSHELKDICDLADRLCFVIHEIFAAAIIFVGVWMISNHNQTVTEYWFRLVLIFYAVWILLCVIWVFVSRTLRKTIHHTKRCNWRRQNKLRATETPLITASIINSTGAISFTVAIIVGIIRS